MKNPDNIRRLREKHQLSRDEFARLVYVTGRTVYSWELGDREMPNGLWELALIKLENFEPVMPKFDNVDQLEITL